jgi:hypothetical protein
MRAEPPFGADGESMPITALAMPIRVFCAPPADHAAEITDPLAERLGCASQSCRLAAGLAAPGASALREGGLTGSPDECTIRACGSAVPRSCGICRPDPVCVFWDCALAAGAPQRAIPDTAVAVGLLRPAGNGTAVSAGGLRGDDRAGRDQVPAPAVPFPGQGDRNYPVASSSAPLRRARISPVARSRLPVSGSGRWAWIW